MKDKATHYLHRISIKNKQREINKKFERNGLSTELLLEQLELNKKKNKLNISDDNNRTYENYVQ